MKPNLNGLSHERPYGKSHHPGNCRMNLLCDHTSPFLRVGENINIGNRERFSASYGQEINGNIPNSFHHIHNGERGDFWMENGNKSHELDEIMFMVDNFQKEMKETFMKQLIVFKRYFSTRTRELEWRLSRLESQNSHLLSLASKLQCHLNAVYKEANSIQVEPSQNMDSHTEIQSRYGNETTAEQHHYSELEALAAKIRKARKGSTSSSNVNTATQLNTKNANGPNSLSQQAVFREDGKKSGDLFSDSEAPLSPIFQLKQFSRSQFHFKDDSLDGISVGNTFQSVSPRPQFEHEATNSKRCAAKTAFAVDLAKTSRNRPLTSSRPPTQVNSGHSFKRKNASVKNTYETSFKETLSHQNTPNKKHKAYIKASDSDENISVRTSPKEKHYETQKRLFHVNRLDAQELSIETDETITEKQRKSSMSSPISVVSESSPEIIVDDDDDENEDEPFEKNLIQESAHAQGKFPSRDAIFPRFDDMPHRQFREEKARTDLIENRDSFWRAIQASHSFQTSRRTTGENREQEILQNENIGPVETVSTTSKNYISEDTERASSNIQVAKSPSTGHPSVAAFEPEVTESNNTLLHPGVTRKCRTGSVKKNYMKKYYSVRSPAPNSLIYKLVAQLNDACKGNPKASATHSTLTQLQTHPLDKSLSVNEMLQQDLSQDTSSTESTVAKNETIIETSLENVQNSDIKLSSRNKVEGFKNIATTGVVNANVSRSSETGLDTAGLPVPGQKDCNMTQSKSISCQTTELTKAEGITTISDVCCKSFETEEKQMKKKLTVISSARTTNQAEKGVINSETKEEQLKLKDTKTELQSNETADSLYSKTQNQKTPVSLSSPSAWASLDTAANENKIENEKDNVDVSNKNNSEIVKPERKEHQNLGKNLPNITVHYQPDSLPPLILSEEDSLTTSFREDLLRKKMKHGKLPKYLMKSFRKGVPLSFERKQSLRNNYK